MDDYLYDRPLANGLRVQVLPLTFGRARLVLTDGALEVWNAY